MAVVALVVACVALNLTLGLIGLLWSLRAMSRRSACTCRTHRD